MTVGSDTTQQIKQQEQQCFRFIQKHESESENVLRLVDNLVSI